MSDHCQELMERFSEYLDGEMCDEECQELLGHLEECACCKNCLETLRQTKNLLNKMPAEDMPADLKERLKNCLKEGREK